MNVILSFKIWHSPLSNIMQKRTPPWNILLFWCKFVNKNSISNMTKQYPYTMIANLSIFLQFLPVLIRQLFIHFIINNYHLLIELFIKICAEFLIVSSILLRLFFGKFFRHVDDDVRSTWEEVRESWNFCGMCGFFHYNLLFLKI